VVGARARSRFARNRSAVVGTVVVGVLIVFALVGPLFAKHGPLESDFVHGVSPDSLPVGPSAEFPLGADRIFRDVFARLAYAGRLSLVVAVAATVIASAIGAAVGILAGWTEGKRVRVPWEIVVAAVGALAALLAGWPRIAAVAALAGGAAAVARWRLGRGGSSGPPLDVDGLLMRLVDVLLAFPFLLLVMAIGAAVEHTSAVTILLTLGVTGWLGTARVVRSKTLQVRSQEYVVAARALGQSTPTLLWKHVLPNVAGTLIVTSTVQVAQMIVADSVLSYLGVGIAPPTPTWGHMLFEGQDFYQAAPWLVAAPGAAILLAVWGFNMLGEGLRDALDPHEA
jgi:ABC-type dipeptide/oligopeptide/nickel transport system permease subunit